MPLTQELPPNVITRRWDLRKASMQTIAAMPGPHISPQWITSLDKELRGVSGIWKTSRRQKKGHDHRQAMA